MCRVKFTHICNNIINNIFYRFLHSRLSIDRQQENLTDEIMRDVQTIAELILEPLITTLLVMDRDILSTITVNTLIVNLSKRLLYMSNI